MEMDGIRFIVAEIDQYRIKKVMFEMLEPSESEVAEMVETEAAGLTTAEAAEQSAEGDKLQAASSGATQPKGE